MSQPEPGAVVDLLAVLAYAELTAFDRLAEDARLAPTLTGRAALARMAAAEIAHHVRLTDRLAELGSDPAAAMAPFTSALDTFHESTRPSTWLEGLVKAYVGDGLATLPVYLLCGSVCSVDAGAGSGHRAAGVVDDDARAARCQQQRVLLTQAATGAGDHCDLSVETHVVGRWH